MLSLQSGKERESLFAAEVRTCLFASLQYVCAIRLHDIKMGAQHKVVVVVVI